MRRAQQQQVKFPLLLWGASFLKDENYSEQLTHEMVGSERERKKRSGWNDMTMMMTKLWKIATRENFRYSQAFVFSFSTIFSHSHSPTFVGTFHVARKQWWKREKRVKHHGMEILCVVSTNKMKRWGEKRFPFEQFKSYLHSNLNHSPIKSHSLWR